MNTFPVPDQLLDQNIGIFGNTGSGKSYTARALVERLRAAFKTSPVYAVDPKGDWWGVRLAADSKGRGLDFLIVGGPHADEGLQIPEEHPEAIAAPIADMLARSDQSVVFDLSELGPEAMRRFVRVLVQRLYEKRRDAYTLILDEADEFAPNGTGEGGEATKCLSVVARLAKRGRGRGSRMWTISQRPASMSTNVRGLMHALAIMNITMPHDAKAVRDWMTLHDPDKAKDLAGTLTKLRTGDQAAESGKPAEGWFWSPKHNFLQRMEWPRISTYDSMATPKHGERRSDVAPKPIDTGVLRKALADHVKAAEENDPKNLKARIRELEANAAGAGKTGKATAAAAVAPSKGELLAEYQRGHSEGVIAGEAKAWQNAHAYYAGSLSPIANAATALAAMSRTAADGAREKHAAYVDGVPETTTSRRSTRLPRNPARTPAATPARAHSVPPHPASTLHPRPRDSAVMQGGGTPGEIPGRDKAEKVINALAFFAAAGQHSPTRDMVAGLLGNHPRNSAFRAAIAELMASGDIGEDQDGHGLRILSAGAAKASPTPTGSAAELILGQLKGRRREILARLLQSSCSTEALAAGFGKHPRNSAFRKDVAALRKTGLVAHHRGELHVAEWIGGAS